MQARTTCFDVLLGEKNLYRSNTRIRGEWCGTKEKSIDWAIKDLSECNILEQWEPRGEVLQLLQRKLHQEGLHMRIIHLGHQVTVNQ